jgi:hypothetical protein
MLLTLNRWLKFACLILASTALLGNVPIYADMYFDIAKSDAYKTLREYSRSSGVNIIYSKKQVKGIQTKAIEGNFDPKQALNKMLEGTPLSYNEDVETGAIAVFVDSKKKNFSQKNSSGNLSASNNNNPTQHTEHKVKTKKYLGGKLLSGLLGFIAASSSHSAAQETRDDSNDDIYVLSPFEVSVEEQSGYIAETTLAGNRLKTELRDIGSAVTVVTSQFMKDVGAKDNSTLLPYTIGTEVGGIQGNFAGTGDSASLYEDTIRPNQNTRVRGLAEADNTRDFFRTDIPWDAYNVDRVDLQRGANSILFGQGSPAGIINAGLKDAGYYDSGSLELKVGSYGTHREALDVNREIIEDQLAIRLSLLNNDEKYQQDPAYSNDQRIYTAVRYEPDFLNGNGVRTTIKANYENGNIDSNNPRYLPPVDCITPWFTDLDQATYNQYGVYDHLTDTPDHGQIRKNLLSGSTNPYYEPYVGAFGARLAPAAFFDGTGQMFMITDVPNTMLTNAIGSNGAIDGTIDSMPDNGWVSIASTSQWALNSNAPYSSAGTWKDNLLTDENIYDFYNNLIDGDTKSEWQDFDVYNLSFAQTFLNDMFGYSLDYNKEHYENGQSSLLGGQVRLFVDPMSVYGDGNVTAEDPYSDGTANPNVGRAFVTTTNNSNSSYENDREAMRATAFMTYDFRRNGDSWWRKLLGVHTVTGMLAEETSESDTRTWQRYGTFDDAAYNLPGRTSLRFNDSTMVPVQVIYLGDSLLGTDMENANIPSISGDTTMTSGQITYFDATWKYSLDPTAADYVDPSAAWVNSFYQDGDDSTSSTQSENPDNYVGWTSVPFNIIDADDSQENRDLLTTSAALNKSKTRTEALIWQGKWLDDALVTTYGWRRDVAKSWAFDMNPSDMDENENHGALNFSPDYYKLPDEANTVEVQSRSYSIVAHLTDLPYVKKWASNLPLDLSVFYNQSTNFKPDASRVDIYGEAIGAPSGKTIDRGIVLASKDGRYSLRVNHYETQNLNATSSQISVAAIGSWMALGANYANVFEYNIISGYDATDPNNVGNDDDVGNEVTENWGAMRYNFHTPGDADAGEPSQILDMEGEAAAIAAFREFQSNVDPRFWEAWRMETFDFGTPSGEVFYTVPTGFAITEDSISRGWEIEFTAEPVKNWRITANASKTKAIRTNVGGENMAEFMELVNSYVSGPAGQLHHYWGTADVVRAADNWYSGEGLADGKGPGSEWLAVSLLDGTSVPECREWRINLITNYDFTEGFLKGLNVGGGMRYQSSVIIGYPPLGDPDDPTEIEYDLDNPFEGPSETYFDFWVGYQRPLTEKINWRIQLNIYNVFQDDNELIPITAQPTGQIAAYRIAPKRSWSITSTFEF